jgi:hypothetical protein
MGRPSHYIQMVIYHFIQRLSELSPMVSRADTPNAILPRVPPALLQRLPEVIRVEELRELIVHINNMDISLPSIPDDCFVVLSVPFPFDIDS